MAGTFIGAGASVASAEQSPRSVAAFIKAAAMRERSPSRSSNMLRGSVGPVFVHGYKASVKAEVPFIKVFWSTAVGKIVFTGKTRNDIEALIQLDNEGIALLAQVESVPSFAKRYPPISNELGQAKNKVEAKTSGSQRPKSEPRDNAGTAYRSLRANCWVPAWSLVRAQCLSPRTHGRQEGLCVLSVVASPLPGERIVPIASAQHRQRFIGGWPSAEA